MNLKFENRLLKSGYQNIVGMDEAGRGSWAGPLVASAVILPRDAKINGVNDSKKLSPDTREKLFVKIIKTAVAWSVGIVSAKEIDEVGILYANKLAFIRALEKINNACSAINIKPQYILIDGVKIFEPEVPYEFVIKGDGKIMSIASASIIAKVARDQLLNQLHDFYPEYNFKQHKGYGTDFHRQQIEKCGLSEIHRLSFRPMEEMVEF